MVLVDMVMQPSWCAHVEERKSCAIFSWVLHAHVATGHAHAVQRKLTLGIWYFGVVTQLCGTVMQHEEQTHVHILDNLHGHAALGMVMHYQQKSHVSFLVI